MLNSLAKKINCTNFGRNLLEFCFEEKHWWKLRKEIFRFSCEFSSENFFNGSPFSLLWPFQKIFLRNFPLFSPKALICNALEDPRIFKDIPVSGIFTSLAFQVVLFSSFEISPRFFQKILSGFLSG